MPSVVFEVTSPREGHNFSQETILAEGPRGIVMTEQWMVNQQYRSISFAFRDTERNLPAGGIVSVFVSNQPKHMVIESAYRKTANPRTYFSAVRVIKGMLRDVGAPRSQRAMIVAHVKSFLVSLGPQEDK